MLSDYTQSDQDASCLDLAGCNPTIPKQCIITLVMLLEWDWKVSEQERFLQSKTGLVLLLNYSAP